MQMTSEDAQLIPLGIRFLGKQRRKLAFWTNIHFFGVVLLGTIAAVCTGGLAAYRTSPFNVDLAALSALVGLIAALLDTAIAEFVIRPAKQQLAALENTMESRLFGLYASTQASFSPEEMETDRPLDDDSQLFGSPSAYYYRLISAPRIVKTVLALKMGCWNSEDWLRFNIACIFFATGAALLLHVAAFYLLSRGYGFIPSLRDWTVSLVGPIAPLASYILREGKRALDAANASRGHRVEADNIWRGMINGDYTLEEIGRRTQHLAVGLLNARAEQPVFPGWGYRKHFISKSRARRSAFDSRLSEFNAARVRIEPLLTNFRVAICGSRPDGIAGPLWEGVIDTLAQALVEVPCVVIHGPKGAGAEVLIRLFNTYQVTRVKSSIAYLERRQIIENANVILAVGGAEGTGVELSLARQLNNLFIAIPLAGGVTSDATVVTASLASASKSSRKLKTAIRAVHLATSAEELKDPLIKVLTELKNAYE